MSFGGGLTLLRCVCLFIAYRLTLFLSFFQSLFLPPPLPLPLFPSLIRRVRRFRANIAKFYCAEVVCGISYLHSFNVIYRDLKPENLLLDQDGHVIITDFGLSKMGDNSTDMATTICGTPEYASPEILQQLPCVAFYLFSFSSNCNPAI